MCHSDDSQVPLPPGGGAAAYHGALTLTSKDGSRVLAYAARAERPNRRGMIILPDVRGLHNFYRQLAVRFAEAGFEAIAIDYFGRTAPNDDRSEAFDFRPHVARVDFERLAEDVQAAIDYLGTAEGGQPSSLFTTGFCFGGTNSWRQSAQHPELAGCIGFYGGNPLERVGPYVERMRAPILMLLAGVDSTPPEEFEDFARRVRAQGVEVESYTYAGAPHSFFDRNFAEWKEACDDAWRRILDFTRRHSRSGAGAG